MTATIDGEYAAAWFEVDDVAHSLEIQVAPGRLTVYISSIFVYRARRAVWSGDEAAAMGLAVCRGECHPTILADWLDEHEPSSWGGRNREFHAPTWLRSVKV